ncbi:MAG TPA: hypothetical protein VFJ95_00440 [Gammaproteobacteria bacterium]|nr:hypothetical protein [Gammaproteobacteria bacterium]
MPGHGPGWFWFVFMMFAMFCWTARGRRGYRRGFDQGPPQHVAKQIEVALAERDATIANLEERVRVLERIVTDSSSHSRRLSEEIERLRA